MRKTESRLRFRAAAGLALAASLLVAPGAAAPQEPAQKPPPAEARAPGGETGLTLWEKSRPLNPKAPLERTIAIEMADISEWADMPIRTQVIEEGGTRAVPGQGLLVDVGQMAAIRDIARAQFFMTTRFILAHEAAHLLQHQRYPRPAGEALDQESQRLFECQADIFAAMYIFGSVGRGIDSDLHTTVDARNAPSTLDVAFNMGGIDPLHGSHPTKAQRRMAVEVGAKYGQLLFLAQAIRSNAEVIPMVAKIMLMEAKYNLRALGLYTGGNGGLANAILKVGAGKSLLDIALDEAQLITNYKQEALHDLSIERPASGYDGGRRKATYDFTCRNTGKRKLSVNIAVRAILVLSDSGERDFSINDGSFLKRYSFTLEPGKSREVRGEIGFSDLGQDDSGRDVITKYTPRVAIPFGELSLITASFID